MANWQLPQDVMHVMLEGVVKLELQLILQVYIFEKRLFTLSFLNSRLESFSYGYSESECKLSLLYATSESNSINFHQSTSGRSLKNICVYTRCYSSAASQCWLFARLLPLIIGDLIPESDGNISTAA